MSESGCLRDGHFQNLEVDGVTTLGGTISGLYSAGTITVVATASDGVAVTGSVTLTQPANTFIIMFSISCIFTSNNNPAIGITIIIGMQFAIQCEINLQQTISSSGC